MENKLSLLVSLLFINITIILLACVIVAKEKNIKSYIYSGEELVN